MHSKEELDDIWDNTSDGTYDHLPPDIRPTRKADDASEQVIDFPEGSRRYQYRRKPGGPWEPVPTLPEKQFD
jgi:hypothetical protein